MTPRDFPCAPAPFPSTLSKWCKFHTFHCILHQQCTRPRSSCTALISCHSLTYTLLISVMPIEHEEPLLVSGSSQYSDTSDVLSPSQHSAPPNPNLRIFTTPSPAHIAYNNTTGQSYHVAAPAPAHPTAHPAALPPLLLYPTNPSAASFVPLTAVPMAMDTILVRVSYSFSWWSWARQYSFPSDVPSFASPHLPSYVSNAEWNASMRRLNAALLWPSAVQLVRLLSLALLLGSVVLMWSKKVRSQKAWTVLCWSCLLLSGVTFVLLTKLYAGRVRKRLIEAVEAEHVYYQNRTSQPRAGMLPSSWRMDGRWLIVSAPTSSPTAVMPVSYIMSPPHVGDGGRAASIHYQHSTELADREGYHAQHTPMEHF